MFSLHLRCGKLGDKVLTARMWKEGFLETYEIAARHATLLGRFLLFPAPLLAVL
jgi:hypothetical protein